MTDIWEEVGRASSGFVALPWLESGEYRVRIERVKEVLSKRHHCPFFVVEMTILESDNPSFPPGKLVSWRVNMSKVSSPQNVRRFILAAMGVDWGDEDADRSVPVDRVVRATRKALSDNQPLVGMEFRLRCYQVPTEAGGEYTVHHWYPRGADAPPIQAQPAGAPPKPEEHPAPEPPMGAPGGPDPYAEDIPF